MKLASKAVQTGYALFASLAAVSAAQAYSPRGPVPQAPLAGETKLWTRQDVDAVVDVSYETADALEPASANGAPAACDKIGFIRFKAKGASDNAEDADAGLLMVPGVLEGANAFDFIGRQMVYLAKTQYGKNIEIWAMDRRANCLEDLTGMQAAEPIADVEQAEDLLIGYYYGQQAIGGKTFAGFLGSDQLPFLYDFGMRQTTLDMYAILKRMMPDTSVSKRKAFVGGHSLGGIHTSLFLSWDFDGNPATTSDVGYNLVAGAFGFDTAIDPPGVSPFSAAQKYMGIAAGLLKPMQLGDGEATYRTELHALQTGRLPRDIYIPGIFSPEVIALPEALGMFADKAPDAPSDALSKVPISPELNGIMKVMHSRDLRNVVTPPFISDFNYTNQAYVGLFFDDNFSSLAFLQLGLGFLDGGPVVRKQLKLSELGKIPALSTDIDNFIGTQPHYIAADAGPDLRHLGQGPLYGWARRDQIGSPTDPDYTSLDGLVQFTYLVNEPSDIRDFSRALYEGPSNLTEWYFPMRILVDMSAVGQSWGPKYGLDIYQDGSTQVPALLIVGDQGLTGHQVGDPPDHPNQQLIVAPGFTHLDPMFAAVDSPSQNDYVMHPLLNFVFANVH